VVVVGSRLTVGVTLTEGLGVAAGEVVGVAVEIGGVGVGVPLKGFGPTAGGRATVPA
jgi:hypothetical protein